MGNESGEFSKHCKACEAKLEVSTKSNKIEVKALLLIGSSIIKDGNTLTSGCNVKP